MWLNCLKILKYVSEKLAIETEGNNIFLAEVIGFVKSLIH